MTRNEAPRWSKNMRLLIVNKLATLATPKQVWRFVTSSELLDTHNINPLDPEVYGYDLFRMRCSRIPKNTIALAHQAWKKTYDGVRFGSEKARVQALSDLIDKVNETIDSEAFDKDTTGTLAALVGQIRGLYEQVRKEISADEDRAALSASGTRILLTNPENVEIDAGHVGELIMIYREEIGGLHKLDFTALNLSELRLLEEAIHATIHTKVGEIEEAVLDTTEELEDKVELPSPTPTPKTKEQTDQGRRGASDFDKTS